MYDLPEFIFPYSSSSSFDALHALGIILNPMQRHVISELMKHQYVSALAMQSTGKTFLAAFLASLYALPPPPGQPINLRVIVFSPTEASVIRLMKMINRLAGANAANVTPLYALSSFEKYSERSIQLQTATRVVVATPDRFLVHQKLGNINLSKLLLVIVDDSAQIFDSGCSKELKKIYEFFLHFPARHLFLCPINSSRLMNRIKIELLLGADLHVVEGGA